MSCNWFPRGPRLLKSSGMLRPWHIWIISTRILKRGSRNDNPVVSNSLLERSRGSQMCLCPRHAGVCLNSLIYHPCLFMSLRALAPTSTRLNSTVFCQLIWIYPLELTGKKEQTTKNPSSATTTNKRPMGIMIASEKIDILCPVFPANVSTDQKIQQTQSRWSTYCMIHGLNGHQWCYNELSRLIITKRQYG